MSDAKTTTGRATSPTDDKATETSPPRAKKKRSAIELAITWNLIALLLLAMLNELRAQSGYKNSLAAVEANFVDRSPARLLTLNDARALMVLFPMESRGNADQREVVLFRWFSPFKKYEILCAVDSNAVENPRLMSVGTRQPAEEGLPDGVAWTMVRLPQSAADEGVPSEE